MMKRLMICISLALTFIYSSEAQTHAKLVQHIKKKGVELVIPFKKYLLPNGLTLILTEDHSDPIVHVDVTYHVGSAREEIGKSGFAHFFEHMMFQGSDHVPNGDHFKIINAAGGQLNGTTNMDKTIYYETIPSNQLEKVLWLESDRMGFLLDAVTQQKFEVQRATVKNERGQNYDNRPYGVASEVTARALYPYGHPYSWPTIGNIEDLNRVNVVDLKLFFLRWYGPNNATLTIGGDIDTKATIAWVEKYFGSIPRGPEVKPVNLPSPLIKSNRYVSYKDAYASLPLLTITYPGAKMYHKDVAALDALSALIGQGSNSVFYKKMVKTHKATRAGMNSSNYELAGQLSINVVPYPGHSLAEMKKLVDDSFVQFEQTGFTDEDLVRYKGSAEALFVSSLASISGKVSSLSSAQTYTGDASEVGKELENIRKITKSDVMRVYNHYIKGKGAVVLSVLPRNGDVQPVEADNYEGDQHGYEVKDHGYAGLTYQKAKDNFDRRTQPKAGANPIVKIPDYWTATTPNGIKMIGSFNDEIPEVTLSLMVKGGWMLAANDPSKAGLPFIVGQMLNTDTEQHTADQISAELDKLGSRIQVSSNVDGTVFFVSSLISSLDKTLPFLRDRLLKPKFTQAALDRVKNQMIQSFQDAKTRPARVASSVYNKILYGAESLRTYGFTGNEQTIEKITLTDIQSYYDRYIVPNLASLVVVGCISEVTVKEKLSFLNEWKEKSADIPAPGKSIKTKNNKTIHFVHFPSTAQSEIRIGYATGINYDATGLYYKLGLVNYALGGGFTGRLNMKLREEKGWTYGASSGFTSGNDGGTFTAYSSVRTSSTDSAITEFINIIDAYANGGITEEELLSTKSSVSQSEALKYETNGQKAAFLYGMYQYDLKPDFVTEQSRILTTLTETEVNELAKKYLKTDEMVILVVGDRDKVMPGLRKLGYKIVEVDSDGKVL